MKGVISIADWYLEDIEGNLHKAFFIEVARKDVGKMKWERKISWGRELTYGKQDGRKVYKLVDSATKMIHGGISMRDAVDHVFIHLIESATHNREDPRRFINVTRLLIAFAGMRSVDIGADGFLALEPKTGLENYYADRYKAYSLTGRKVGIAGPVTKYWIRVYYK
ncbi:hypothetical protein [Paenibacillus sp. URB8-2]|uniref:hypothetical protein n=1 Tax=Paenibacillus sp. URB8-2 TaxID=2741301 RepID=UPI001E5C443E|nr:hypothetical protein [Paenibacillus sp. URB8-2]